MCFTWAVDPDSCKEQNKMNMQIEVVLYLLAKYSI